MTFPPPHPAAQNSIASGSTKSSGVRQLRSQQSAWGLPPPGTAARRGLTPLSTDLGSASLESSNRPTANSSSSSPFTSTFSSIVTSSGRTNPNRATYSASPSSSYPPLQSGSQQAQATTPSLLSPRSRAITPSSTSHLPASAAASSTASQGGGGSSGGGGGGSRSQTFSPSLPQQSLSSPTSNTFDRSALQTQPTSSVNLTGSSSVSKIVVTQVFILLGSITEKEGRAKWESQAEAIRKLVESNGMEVFAKYFRRLLSGNSPQIFPGISRNVENQGNYQLLVQEMDKITQDPIQATKVAEIIDASEGDIYRDFDLATFIEHFKLNPLAKTLLATAFLHVSKPDLNTKAGSILSQNYPFLLQTLAIANNDDSDVEIPASLLATCAFKYLEDLPHRYRTGTEKANISEAFRARYLTHELQALPSIVRSTLALADVMESGYELARDIHQRGPRITASVEAAKEFLARYPDDHIDEKLISEALLYLVLTPEWQLYSPAFFVAAVQGHATRPLHWSNVVRQFDQEGLVISGDQFLSLYKALLPLTQHDTSFEIRMLWAGRWQNPTTQLYFVLAIASLPPSDLDATTIPDLSPAYDPSDCSDGPEEVTRYIDEARRDTSISLDVITAIIHLAFSRELQLSRDEIAAIQELMQGPKIGFLLCSALGVPQAQRDNHDRMMERLLIPTLSRSYPAYSFTLHSLWKQDKSWLATKLSMFHIGNPLQLPLLLEHAQQHKWLDDLLTLTTSLGIDLAAFAHRKNLIDLDQWAQDKLANRPDDLVRQLTRYLEIKVEDELRVARREQPGPKMIPLATKTVVTMLNVLHEHAVARLDQLIGLERQCISTYPRIIIFEEGMDEGTEDDFESSAISGSVDAEMQDIYKRMYGGDLDVNDVVHTMQGFRESDDPVKRDLFACMVHGLFDEYSCFADYPLGPLATTSVLFGGIISRHLISGVTLRVGLGMILEGVRDHNSSDAMFKFGLQALLHMQQALEEWPSYCAELAAIPELQGSEVHARVLEILSGPDIQRALSADPNGINGLPDGLGLSNGEIDEYLTPNISFRSVNAEPSGDHEEPDEGTQEKVIFFFNNVSEQNVASKVKELQKALPERHRSWFAFLLVEQRAKLEPNLQQLYLDVLKLLGDKPLWAEVLRETYVSVQKMLNAESTMQLSNERKNLKSLASWLGSLTIAQDKPIKHRDVAFKDLLIEGYDTERLLIVIPFVCNVLVQAKRSTVFKPPNPWTVDIIRVLLELYHFSELKLNQKFEIEVLCKELDINRNTLEASTEIRSRPLQDEDLPGPIMPDGLDAFDDLALNRVSRNVRNARFSPATIASTLPDFSRDLRFPPSSGSPATQARLREIVQVAVQKAVLEIIAPVVERSVTIAAIATKKLINKDYVSEDDEDKIREGAQKVVRELAGSLALVTCKEPLRMSMNNHIRVQQEELAENTIPEGAVLMCVNDNLDTACEIVLKQAEERSVPEIEAHLEVEFALRRQHHADHPNEPFIGAAYNDWSRFIPDPYKITAGGLKPEQMAIYSDFARQSRGPPSHAPTPSVDSGRQLPDVLQEPFATVPNLPTPVEAPAAPQHPPQPLQMGRMLPPPLTNAVQTNGSYEPRLLQDKVQDFLERIIHLTRERPERALKDLDQKGPLVHAINQMWDLIVSAPVQVEAVAWSTAQMTGMALYQDTDNLLAVDVLVQLLDKLCQLSNTIYKEIITEFAHQDDEKVLNAAVTTALLEVGLLDIHQVDLALANLLANRREEAIETLSDIMDALLLNDYPVVLRADFVASLSALGQWLLASPDLKAAEDLVRRLRDWGALEFPPYGPGDRSQVKKLHFQYTFNEWLALCGQASPSERVLGAFVAQLHSRQMLNSKEDVAFFLRVCIDCTVDAHEHDEGIGPNDGYFLVDGLAKLIVFLVKHQGEADGAVKASKPAYMHSLLSLVVLIVNFHHVMRGEQFNQRVFFRLFSSVLCEWNDHPRYSFPHDREMALVFAECFLTLQPRYLPAFTYSWLMLISHRMFMPALLKLPDNEVRSTHRSARVTATDNSKGWEPYTKVMDVMFSYISDMVRPPMPIPFAKDLYRGALRIMLILHHDFPEFLAENHYRLCNAIPPDCTQLRNLVLSAFPSSFAEVPDPFTAGLKVDRLEEIRRAPRIGGNTVAPLIRAHIKDVLDNIISGSSASDDTLHMVLSACGPFQGSGDVDCQLLHAIVLYLGESAIDAAGRKGGPSFDNTSPQATFMTTLAKELHPEARYHFLSSITNQLRYPNSHTHYFSYALLHLFGSDLADQQESDVRQQITRVLLERLIVHRPHPWGLIITLLELLKNPAYMFWDLPFIKAAPEIERLFNALFDTIHSNPRPALT
ncbi:MAG: hypothetical protein LQ348_003382 [Seirophora lacunosa]|nr:MAG: hypothetical protein LQ348_003382 [Seirophora lacunosa]